MWYLVHFFGGALLSYVSMWALFALYHLSTKGGVVVIPEGPAAFLMVLSLICGAISAAAYHNGLSEESEEQSTDTDQHHEEEA